MKMTDISKHLQEVNDILSASCTQKRLSFDEALCLSLFYRDFKDTNALVEEAEMLAGKDAPRLHGLALSLFSEAERYLTLDKTAMSATDWMYSVGVSIRRYKFSSKPLTREILPPRS